MFDSTHIRVLGIAMTKGTLPTGVTVCDPYVGVGLAVVSGGMRLFGNGRAEKMDWPILREGAGSSAQVAGKQIKLSRELQTEGTTS